MMSAPPSPDVQVNVQPWGVRDDGVTAHRRRISTPRRRGPAANPATRPATSSFRASGSHTPPAATASGRNAGTRVDAVAGLDADRRSERHRWRRRQQPRRAPERRHHVQNQSRPQTGGQRMMGEVVRRALEEGPAGRGEGAHRAQPRCLRQGCRRPDHGMRLGARLPLRRRRRRDRRPARARRKPRRCHHRRQRMHSTSSRQAHPARHRRQCEGR